MANSTPSTEQEVPPEWLRLLYQLAHSDIRWAKEQGWRVVNWALLLYAANLGLHRLLKDVPTTSFALLDAAIGVIAVVYLADLHHFASGTRASAFMIQAQIPGVGGFLQHRQSDRNHVAYFVVQVAVVIVSLVLAVLALPYV